MLRNLLNLASFRTLLIQPQKILTSTEQPVKFSCSLCNRVFRNEARSFHKSCNRFGGEDRRALAATMPKRDEGADGEKSVDIDSLVESKGDIFPDANLPNRLFNGIPFKDLPIVDIKATKNNTIMTVSDDGKLMANRSCGMEGFKNTRKGTNIAAQATATTFSSQVLKLGYRTVRVRVRGLGPGRVSAIKGLQMGGINIVSITDNTPISWLPSRPRKQRRI